MEGPHRCSRVVRTERSRTATLSSLRPTFPRPARAKCSCANLMLSSDPTQRAWIALKPSHGHPVFASWPETGRKLKSAARLACTYLREGFKPSSSAAMSQANPAFRALTSFSSHLGHYRRVPANVPGRF